MYLLSIVFEIITAWQWQYVIINQEYNYNYLSSTICEELIEIIAKDVLAEICTRMKRAKYYSVSVDSTKDEGHIN